jgi:transposase
MKSIREIIRLSVETDSSLRTISRATLVSRPVVNEYIRKFRYSGLTYEEIKGMDDDSLLMVFKDKTVSMQDRYSQLSKKFDYYLAELKKPYVTIEKLWEEYIHENPQGFKRSQFFNHLQKWRAACKLTMHIEHKAGDRMFIDFTGKKLYITDRQTGVKKPAETFVAILPASHVTFVQAVENQKTESWIKGSEEALWYFGGTPKIIVPDCAKAAVNKATRYEPFINSEYARFAEHYEVIVLPARPHHPDDKALVENAVKIVYHWIYASLRDQVFYSIGDLNHAIRKELENYNSKKMQGTGLSRKELFETTEKNSLGQLPLQLYESKESCKATIQSNYHVLLSADKQYYSVPYSFYGKSLQQIGLKTKAEILSTRDSVEIYFKNERIAVHKRARPGVKYTTNPEHMPESHRAYLERWNPEKIIALAKSAGIDVATMVEKIISRHVHPEQSYNTCRGIIFLAKSFGNDRLNKACKTALYFKQYSYKAVKEILDHKREEFTPEPDLFDPLPEHSNIRGCEYYQKSLKEELAV